MWTTVTPRRPKRNIAIAPIKQNTIPTSTRYGWKNCSCPCCSSVKSCKLHLLPSHKDYVPDKFFDFPICGNEILEGMLREKAQWGETAFDLCDDPDPSLRYAYTKLNFDGKTLTGVQTRIHNNTWDPHSARKDWKTPFASRRFIIVLK